MLKTLMENRKNKYLSKISYYIETAILDTRRVCLDIVTSLFTKRSGRAWDMYPEAECPVHTLDHL